MASEPLFIDLSDHAIESLKREVLMPLADAAARLFRNEIVEGMDPGPARTGRTYLVPGTKTPYTASAPGQPPAIREGIYRDAWEVQPPVDDGEAIRAFVTNSVMVGSQGQYPLGEILEEGTLGQVGMGGAVIKPRPHIRPAKLRVAPKIRALVKRVTGP